MPTLGGATWRGITTKQCISKGSAKQCSSINGKSISKDNISVNSESIIKLSTINDESTSKQSISINSESTSKQSVDNVNDNGVAAQQDFHTIKHASGQKPSNNTSVNSEDEMEYKSVQGNKRPAADDGSSD